MLVTRRKITFTISYRAQNLPSFLFYLLLSKVGKIYQYFRGLSQNIFPLAFVGYEMKSARFISYPKCACGIIEKHTVEYYFYHAVDSTAY